MPAKRKCVPPLRPNADGTGFVRTDANCARQDGDAPEVRRDDQPRRGRDSRGSQRAASDRQAGGGEPSSSYASCSTPSAAGEGASRTGDGHSDGRMLPSKGSGATARGKDSVTAANPGEAKKLSLSIVVDGGLMCNECRVSPFVMRQLGVGSGSILQVVCDAGPECGTTAYLEALLSVSGSRDTIALASDTKTVLLSSSSGARESASTTVTVTPLHTVPARALSHVSLCAFVDSESQVVAQAASDINVPTGGENLQWRALFREAFRNRVVFAGMRACLKSPSAHTVVCEVLSLRHHDGTGPGNATVPTPSHVGFLSTSTEIVVESGTGASDTDGVQDNTGQELDPVAGKETTLVQQAAPRHTLVLGDAGVGKSYYLRQLITALEREGRQRVFVIRVEELPQGEESEVSTATALREVFATVKRSAPCTVVLDDLHLICGGQRSSSGASSSIASAWAVALVTATLCGELRDIAVRQLAVRVVASAVSREALDGSLLTSDRLGGHVVQFSSPATAHEREACLLSCLRALGQVDTVPLDAVRDIAAHGHGYTQRDLQRVAEAAMMQSFKRRGSTTVEAADLRQAAKLVHPSSLREFEVTIPEVTWDDIGGSELAKRTLQEVVAWCLGKQSWVFTEFNLSPPKGVLLYGPPGCSKTMLAKALANESRMNFVSVKGPEVFSKWVGDSEKAVRDIFARARAAAPCVVFIDELDGMCGHRGRGGVSDRVISQFLTELDGLPSAMQQEEARVGGGRSSALVFVAATNRPDNIDGAVLRPGRIDRRVHVGLPELAEREAIAKIQFKQLPTHPNLTPLFIAESTAGYTGAEVVAVVKEAAFTAISHDMGAACVTRADVEHALSKVRPRVNAKDVEWYKNWPHNTPANPFVVTHAA